MEIKKPFQDSKHFHRLYHILGNYQAEDQCIKKDQKIMLDIYHIELIIRNKRT